MTMNRTARTFVGTALAGALALGVAGPAAVALPSQVTRDQTKAVTDIGALLRAAGELSNAAGSGADTVPLVKKVNSRLDGALRSVDRAGKSARRAGVPGLRSDTRGLRAAQNGLRHGIAQVTDRADDGTTASTQNWKPLGEKIAQSVADMLTTTGIEVPKQIQKEQGVGTATQPTQTQPAEAQPADTQAADDPYAPEAPAAEQATRPEGTAAAPATATQPAATQPAAGSTFPSSRLFPKAPGTRTTDDTTAPEDPASEAAPKTAGDTDAPYTEPAATAADPNAATAPAGTSTSQVADPYASPDDSYTTPQTSPQADPQTNPQDNASGPREATKEEKTGLLSALLGLPQAVLGKLV
ncbi:hypothetical protein [Streptomyces sp. NPDC003077]|uniref:hypothetical protein n=1 Tax=Streptomyces sp. NPDC003077 TaxID=3154443 RepID=UPI0033AFEB23